MNPPELGDTAIITVGDNYDELIIRDVTPGRIHLSYPARERFASLIETPKGWQVEGYLLPHTVQFRKASHPALTGIPEVDAQILLDLDRASLARACQTNQYLYRICQNDYFWKQRVEQEFGDLVNLKSPKITYQQQYEGLVKKSLHDAIFDDRVDVLELLSREGELPNYRAADEAAARGYIDVLDWMASKEIFPSYEGWGAAVEYGQLEVVKWMVKRELISAENLIDLAATEHQFDILEWLHGQGASLDTYTINDLVESKDYDLMEWLYRENLLTNEQADLAAELGMTDVLKWLSDRGISATIL